MPFRQFVLKIHSRCNLACDHCYVYEAADQTWRAQPRVMDAGTVQAVAARVAEHARRHGLDAVRVTLHGGEPLLVGFHAFCELVDVLRARFTDGTRLDIDVQTNGLLLDQRFADYMLAQRIRVGISLDGGRIANDRHRRFPHGASSYDQAVRAIRLMASPPYRDVFAGLLCTVDPDNDPKEVFGSLAALAPPRIDVLLPHATWEAPPPSHGRGATPYGNWLADCFDAWYDTSPEVGVRLFEEVMHALLGGVSLSEAIGLSVSQAIVIETDGSIQLTDALKVAYHGAPSTGDDVFGNTFDEVLERLDRTAVDRGLASLSGQCRACSIVRICGGGLYPHRYRAANGFDNPSVYCADLMRFVLHVQERLRRDLARTAAPAMGSEPTRSGRPA